MRWAGVCTHLLRLCGVCAERADCRVVVLVQPLEGSESAKLWGVEMRQVEQAVAYVLNELAVRQRVEAQHLRVDSHLSPDGAANDGVDLANAGGRS